MPFLFWICFHNSDLKQNFHCSHSEKTQKQQMFHSYRSLCRQEFIINPPSLPPFGLFMFFGMWLTSDSDVHVFLFLPADTVNHAWGLRLFPVIYCSDWGHFQRTHKHQKVIQWVNAESVYIQAQASYFLNSLYFAFPCWQISEILQIFSNKGVIFIQG